MRGREMSYWVSTADGVLVDLAKVHAIYIPVIPPTALERQGAFVVQAAFGQSDRWDLARFDIEEEARAMMDSPVKKAFDFLTDEKPETLEAYDVGHRFGHGCLLARRLIEQGARVVMVEYQYQPFGGFDTHENGRNRLVKMKQQVDRPIGTLIKDLHERGLLERTLVVIATEFGRTIANQPAAGREPDGFAETATGDTLSIDAEPLYGFHGHFSSVSNMLFFGGGIKKGHAHGKTAPTHPMLAIENPVTLPDVHATILQLLGIDSRRLEVPGRKRLEIDHGKPIREILA